MNSELVRKIADAVLYEGYILYPYRRSAIKNQQRWNFGVLYPQSYAEAQTGHDAWRMQTEILAVATSESKLNVSIRFLHLVNREVGRLAEPAEQPVDVENVVYTPVASLELEAGEVLQSWEEAREREVEVSCDIKRLAISPLTFPFSFESNRTFARLQDGEQVVGVVVRKNESVEGQIVIAAHKETDELYKVHVSLINRANIAPGQDRERALARSLLSAHIIVGIENGALVSQLDPPGEYRSATAACRNVGCWPVLVGAEGERDTMLASPIVLYDYPQIADQSNGDLFDGTEIDEILSLRILTLTDDEKREVQMSDARAQQILQRTEAIPVEQFMKMHGVMKAVNRES